MADNDNSDDKGWFLKMQEDLGEQARKELDERNSAENDDDKD